ncbi:insecticidal delta-endotoxin Cry8Ea1 family protein, partial [Bacillus thuringiensis]|nr:insecticidal delta-endotoxin Cry8Ea1 family protein [Bacillus thuringiensis]
MSPNNQNEYEIINATPSTSVSSDSNRYPFANEPSNALQNMNYKDYLGMLNGEDSRVIGYRPGFLDVLDISSIMLGVFGGAAPYLSAVLGIISVLWPGGGNDVWEDVFEAVEELIGIRIEEYARNKALAELQGLGEGLRVYQRSLESWLENPNDTRAQSVVVSQFIDLESAFVRAMPSFAVAKYEAALLPVYAQAANLHLMLLRDASIYGTAWGLQSYEITDYYDRQVELTETYTNNCVNTYQKGLDNLRGSSAQDWIKYNSFRRNMTLAALDIVVFFPFHDIKLYPIKTQTQLTRTVYSDPLGYAIPGQPGSRPPWYKHARSFLEIENEAILPPNVFKILTGITIYTKRLSDPNFRKYYWAGHKTLTKTTTSPNKEERSYGDISSPTSTQTITLDNHDVYRVKSEMSSYTNLLKQPRNFVAVKAQFDKISSNNVLSTTNYVAANETYGGYIEKRDSANEIPAKESPAKYGDSKEYSHRLSSITIAPLAKPSSFTTYGLVPVLGWTHVSADLNNTIYSDKITQIPAVKTWDISSPGSYIKGPGHTGGDLLQYIRRGSAGGFLLNRYSYTLEKAGKYLVRLRYAADADIVLYVDDAEIQMPKTMNPGEDLKFKTFKVAAAKRTMNLLENGSLALKYLYLYDPNSTLAGTVYVDRIEFIPV